MLCTPKSVPHALLLSLQVARIAAVASVSLFVVAVVGGRSPPTRDQVAGGAALGVEPTHARGHDRRERIEPSGSATDEMPALEFVRQISYATR
ncbi:hypothetical protein OJ998_02255 [Solirubrobacter taibaiensis]|nr:hypothetical protein [Solirubrobacter taibaiensis]